MAEDELSASLFIRIAEGDRQALDDLARQLPLKVAGIARIALRIGVAELQRNPGRILDGRAKTKTAAKKRRKR